MGGCLGINIGKSDAAFVFIHAVGWYGAGDDLAKKAIGRRGRRRRVQVCFHISKIFWMPSIGPWVVSRGEGRTIGDGGMARGPKVHEGMRCRIVQRGLAESLEPTLCRGLRIGDDAVNRLLPIHIGSVFDRSA